MSVIYEVDGNRRHAPVWAPGDLQLQSDWPLIVFLHAYEERGDSHEHLQVGIGPALESHPALYRCLVLLPQCPRDRVWSVADRDWAKGYDSAEHHIDAAIQSALSSLPIDPHRVTLTGASMGGFGAFAYAAKNPHRFRGVAPVCGGGDPGTAEQLRDQDLWAMHGTEDRVVDIEESRSMVRAIQDSGNTRARLTELEGVGHDAWDVAYRDPAFAEFLSGHT